MGHRARGRDALEGKGPQRRPQQRLGRLLEEVAKAVGGGYCRLQMPLSPAFVAVRGTVAGHRLGALGGGGGGVPPSPPMHPWPRGSRSERGAHGARGQTRARGLKVRRSPGLSRRVRRERLCLICEAPRRRELGSGTAVNALPVGQGGPYRKKKRFATPTEASVHGDALCFMVKTWAGHKTTETVVNNGWRLAAVGGWRLAAVGGWRLAAVGGWRLAVGGWRLAVCGVGRVGGRWSLGAVLKGCP